MPPDSPLICAATRRRVLAWLSVALVGAAGPLAGCTAGDAAAGQASPPPAPDPARLAQLQTQRRLRQQTWSDEQLLLAAYRRTQARHPQLQQVLAVPYAHHRAHAGALAGGQRTVAGSTAVPPSVTPAPTAVPADPQLALNNLTALERAVARRRRTACASATGELAALIGTLGACEAAHAELLGAG